MLISLQLKVLIPNTRLAAAWVINPTIASRIQGARLFTAIKYERILLVPHDTNIVIYEAEGRPNVRL